MCDTVKKKSKRSFSDNWLTDDRFKSWIRKVSFDDSLFHCIICNKNFSCNSYISRHAKSMYHKRRENTSLLNNADNNSSANTSKKVTYKQQSAKQQWFEIEQFKPWLHEVPHNANVVFCSVCNKYISAYLSHIYRHADSTMHVNKCSVETSTCNVNEEVEMQTDETFLSFDDRKKSAEIRYAALIVDKNISHTTAKIILNFFQDVGKDPEVLKNMSMGRTKCTNVISNVLCPVETDRVIKNIQNSKFSVFIDETSDISNEKWMTFLVRYVNSETLDVHSQLVKLINIDAKDCSADKLFNAFKMEMWKQQIPFSNIVALSCDNASVMTGKHLSFKKKLEEMSKNLLTFSCPCHSIALVAHAACSKIPQVCEEFLKKIASYINSSPKRSAIFREFSECFQETSHKILRLSDTRWLSRHLCVERILTSWDTIKHFLTEMVVSEKTKSGEYLLSIMQNIDMKAYLLFLKYILNFLNTFNAFFQAVETRIHLLQPKSMNFLFQISKHFLKPELLQHLLKINFSEKENHKSLQDINLGSECEDYLNRLAIEGNTNAVTNIREHCLQFYVTAAEEIRKRLPVTDKFLYKLKVFQSHTALFDIDRKTSFNDVSFIIKTIGGFDEDNIKQEWFTLYSDFTVTEKQNLSKLNFDEMWKQILQTNVIKYPNLTLLLNAIRSLPNSNADSERIFSFLPDIKTKKRNKLSSTSMNAICVVKSALQTRRENIITMKINEKHLSLMSSDTLYAKFPIKQKSSLTLYAAYEDDIANPSTSGNT